MSLLHNFIVLFPSTSSDSLLVHYSVVQEWTETIVGNKTLLLQTIIDVTAALAGELNINQETFKEIEMISRNLCYDLHVQRTLMYRRIKLAG
jgi:hypothetical protein